MNGRYDGDVLAGGPGPRIAAIPEVVGGARHRRRRRASPAGAAPSSMSAKTWCCWKTDSASGARSRSSPPLSASKAAVHARETGPTAGSRARHAPLRVRGRLPMPRPASRGLVGSSSRACMTPPSSSASGATICGSKASWSKSWRVSTHCPTWFASSGPGPAGGSGVLVDHLVRGSKEAAVAGGGVQSAHVLVTGHPYVDVWQAVKPASVGISGWPDVPRGIDWKTGVCEQLGWSDPQAAWRNVLAGRQQLRRSRGPAADGGRAAHRFRHRTRRHSGRDSPDRC